jgi:hypothetical protein
MLLKKNILILVKDKKNNLIQNFCHVTYCWILEKKFSCCPKKKFWTKQKTIPPLQVKWSVPNNTLGIETRLITTPRVYKQG